MDPLIKIGLYQTLAIVSFPTTLPVGTHVFRIYPAGSGLLSTVFVRSASGSVTVRYFDYGASNDEDPEARTDRQAHPSLGANSTNRMMVTRFHNNLRVEIIVAGGPAEVGLLATVTDAASDAETSTGEYDPTDPEYLVLDEMLVEGDAEVILAGSASVKLVTTTTEDHSLEIQDGSVTRYA